MQHTTGVAVVATQRPDTDRRALSQAWYSALHLAERPTARPTPHAHPPFGGMPRGSRSAGGLRDASLLRSPGGGDFRTPARYSTVCGSGGSAECERRAPKTELSRRIERAPARRPPCGAPASFAVRGGDGRVHLVVRSDGAHTRVVAVCAPPLRERVERALAHARFALAGRGARAEVA